MASSSSSLPPPLFLSSQRKLSSLIGHPPLTRGFFYSFELTIKREKKFEHVTNLSSFAFFLSLYNSLGLKEPESE